jgi:hypothetical protein
LYSLLFFPFIYFFPPVLGFKLRTFCYTASPFCFSYFSDRIFRFLPGSALALAPPAHTSCVQMYYHAQIVGWDGVSLTFLSRLASNWDPPFLASQVARTTGTWPSFFFLSIFFKRQSCYVTQDSLELEILLPYPFWMLDYNVGFLNLVVVPQVCPCNEKLYQFYMHIILQYKVLEVFCILAVVVFIYSLGKYI